MKRKGIMKRALLIVMAVVLLLPTVLSAGAISWSGDGTAGGSANGSVSGGYSIPYGTAVGNIFGYRFSGRTGSGDRPKEGVYSIDVILTGRTGYVNSYTRMQPQYSKIDYFQTGFGGNQSATSPTTFLESESKKGYNAYGFAESDMDFDTALPNYNSSDLAGDLKTWQNNDLNIDVIARALGWADGLAGMGNNDRIIIEPLFGISIAGENLMLTATEIAWVSGILYGWNFNGVNNGVGYADGTWGTIGYQFTHMNFPNALYTPDDVYFGWNDVSTAATSSQTSAKIITSGYGVGICYQKAGPTMYTNQIGHWMWGFKQSEGNNGTKAEHNF